MSDIRPDGGSAFPVTCHPADMVESYGMTLRDYFAGQALLGFMHIKAVDKDATMFWDQVAIHCYEAADAMLAERAK